MKSNVIKPHAAPLGTAPFAAAIVTSAAFGKLFVPFFLIGSTAVFSILCAAGLALIAPNWRSIRDDAKFVYGTLIALGVLYGALAASYFVHSTNQVPLTQLLGVLIFHSLFLIFGFASARSLTTVFLVLLGQATIYLIYILRYVIEFGDVVRDGVLQNIFGLEDFLLSIALHLHIASALGLALLSLFGFRARAVRLLALIALPFVFFFILHLSARTVVLALIVALAFSVWAELWIISRKWALTSLATLVILAAATSTLFYRFALTDANVNAGTPNIIARTIKEIQSDDPGNRLPIWGRTWHRLASDPRQFLLGRGVGSFPIDEGVGAPDWLLHKTEGARHYPHDVHLEVLYESGILALLAFSFLTAFPLVYSLKYWAYFEAAEKAAICLYVFYLVSVDISGSFAYGYDFQFFLALAIGVISIKKREIAQAQRSRTVVTSAPLRA